MKTKISWRFLAPVFILFVFFSISLSPSLTGRVHATNTETNPQITLLNQKINQYQAALKQVGSEKKTLQNTLKTLHLKTDTIQTKISLNEKNIGNVQSQIHTLTQSIARMQSEISVGQKTLAKEIRNVSQADDQPIILKILGAGDFSEMWDNIHKSLELQGALQENSRTLMTKSHSLASSKETSQSKQKVLALQKHNLVDQKQLLVNTQEAKQDLLKKTGAKESKFQELLAQAKAQLKSFSTFAKNAGESGIIGNQTVCDAWGCYYNQRDQAWGDDSLNGTKYKLASDGCLVTSMAMVMTHYGYKNVSPLTINSNASNFAAYYPALLGKTIHVDGITATRVPASIDATLATGNPVIVGIHAYGGTHFVVLVSGSNGNYIMRDPYIKNGKDVSFTAHYRVSSIYEVNKVEIH